MQLQDLSFRLDNEYIKLDHGVTLSVEVFSFDNVFHPRKGSLKQVGNRYISHELIWGGSEFEPTSFIDLEVKKIEGKYLFNLSAGLNQKIRETKLRFENLPLGNLISTINGEHETKEYGEILHYPEGWRSLMTPLLVFRLSNDKF